METNMTPQKIREAARALAKRWIFTAARGAPFHCESQGLWQFFDWCQRENGGVSRSDFRSLRPEDRRLVLKLMAAASDRPSDDVARMIRDEVEGVTAND
jgi:hypothetical protein